MTFTQVAVAGFLVSAVAAEESELSPVMKFVGQLYVL